ncbi:hypothetical protein [Pseudanabaena sp. SR411]|uniref:hypothetical protein n=1 Tax=Pseudanabaena sp. SR411 TaxID=1980935 RepID=UPI0011407118|nr:hypothetical protein [Pseudanabaena sp. SR411]
MAARGLLNDVTECETTSKYCSLTIEKAIEILDNVSDMTPSRTSLFKHSSLKFSLQDGSQLRTWTSRGVGGDHVFLADPDGEMIYGGFVWRYADELKSEISRIKRELT